MPGGPSADADAMLNDIESQQPMDDLQPTRRVAAASDRTGSLPQRRYRLS
jgi:hypothetical protein